MLFPISLTIGNYRSLRERIELPFSRKLTFVVGPNNAGKSNILRVLGILFNNAYDRLDEARDFDGSSKKVLLSLRLRADDLQSLLAQRPITRHAFETSGSDHLLVDLEMSREGLDFPTNNPHVDEIFAGLFRHSRAFLDEYGQSGPNNRAVFLHSLGIRHLFKGTTFVPHLRFITDVDKEPPQFSQWKMPGETIAFGSVVKRLATMDRPDPESRFLRKHKQQIEDFVAYCLDKGNVRIEVPDSKKTIMLNIDGDERPIDSFGTGVEQLTMIGLAAIGFPEKLVLIEEPELNLHPRAQKKIIKYLDANVDAQFVIATHSAAVLDAAEADIIQITNSGSGTQSRTLKRNKERYQAVRDLGHSPSELLQTRFAIWVEGPSDRIYLNHWIRKLDERLIEGVDYTILFYGGKILSHHSFTDVESELVRAVSLSRAFAVVIDSDRKPGKPHLNATKARVREEVQREGGICWITDGREIENYLPISVIQAVAKELAGVSVPADKRDQVLDPEKVKKTDFARSAVAVESDEWPLDLKKNMTALVTRIRQAR